MALLKTGHRIVAFDPGVTSGLAIGTYEQDGKFKLVRCAEIAWEERFQAILDAVVGADWIVYERFALYKTHAQEMINNEFPSVQFIGAIQMAAYQSGKLDRIYTQAAHERKNVEILTLDRKAAAGSAHKADAYMHLRYFCMYHKRDKT